MGQALKLTKTSKAESKHMPMNKVWRKGKWQTNARTEETLTWLRTFGRGALRPCR